MLSNDCNFFVDHETVQQQRELKKKQPVILKRKQGPYEISNVLLIRIFTHGNNLFFIYAQVQSWEAMYEFNFEFEIGIKAFVNIRFVNNFDII